MDEEALEEELLRALRSTPGSGVDALAALVGLPRTNFGRRLTRGLHETLERLAADGLVEEDRGRYRLTDEGRRELAERQLRPRV
jgi:coproporphyrinogen III oxidase-like Fe-S oxidoreductase